MNNPVRVALQRYLMARWFERLGGRVPAGLGLEIGCGRGAALRPLRERFGLRWIVGMDLDPHMLRLARRRDPGAALVLADATRTPFADGTFDAVFDLGAIHFVAGWESALDEVRRILRAGGRYYFEWVTGPFLRAFYPLATHGFERMRVPTPDGLIAALERRGLAVGERVLRPRVAASATWLVGDVIGVGRVTP
jgi:ubiquinone/menaquinone biosynthesis C-methylase UbiE